MPSTIVPALGFPGERAVNNYLLEIPVLPGKNPIRVYGWAGTRRGYNLFFPEQQVGGKRTASFKDDQLLDLICCIHDYLNTHGGNNVTTQDDRSGPEVREGVG